MVTTSVCYELKRLMESWLREGNELQKSHARQRLAKPDLIECEAEANPYPSLVQQAKNASVAFGSAVASGFAHVDQAEQNRRLAICHACDVFDTKQGRCSKCGCFTKWKTWLATQKCPIGKW